MGRRGIDTERHREPWRKQRGEERHGDAEHCGETWRQEQAGSMHGG